MKLRHAALLLLLAGCEGHPGSSPQPFNLDTPALNAKGVLVSSSFIWDAAIRADTYEIEIGTDSTFAATLFSASGLTTTTFTPASALPMSTTLFWRVQAFNEKGSVSSVIATFNSEGPPGAFSLVAPTNGDPAVVGPLPTYSWTASAVADTYLLEITSDPTFVTIDFSLPGITTITATPAFALAPATPYYWRVTAQNTFGNVVATGAPFSFTTA